MKLLYLFFKHRDVSKVNMEADRVETRLFSEMQFFQTLNFSMIKLVSYINGDAYNYSSRYIFRVVHVA